MRHAESEQPGLSDLLRENEDLKRQIETLKSAGHGTPHDTAPKKIWRPSATAIWAIFILTIVLILVAFLAGYRPLIRQQRLIAAEAREQEKALPRVGVVQVRRPPERDVIQLPGNIEAITEAPILARAD